MNVSIPLNLYSFNSLILICFLFLLSSCNPSEKTGIVPVQGKLDSLKKEYVPDRRVQIFDFEISKDGTRVIGSTSNEEAYQQVMELKTFYPNINLDSFFLSTPLGQALVNVSVCNLRSLPKHSAELVTQALLGQPMTIWKKEGSWLYVQTVEKYLGWVDAGAITELSKKDMATYGTKNKVMFTDDFGICIEKPENSSGVVSDIVAGNILVQSGLQSGFYKVVFPDGRQGYIPSHSANPVREILNNPVPDWVKIEKTARRFMGRPYLWGGTSGKGVDCSGFTKMVYYLHGLLLPRDASQQVHSGKEVAIDHLENLQPGDFLFFGEKGKNGKNDRVTHVAIHLGDGKIIHSSEKVRIESINPGDEDYNPYRKKTLLSAKRMISNGIINNGVLKLDENEMYDVF